MQPTEEWLTKPGGLSEHLRTLRTTAGLTGAQLAERCRWPRQSKVSKIERGKQLPSEDDIRQWVAASLQPGQPDPTDELLQLRRTGSVIRQDWQHQLRTGHAKLQAEYAAMDEAATDIRNFEVLVIPGLLQTPEYARARMGEAVFLWGTSPEEVDAAVEARIARQAVLQNPRKTFRFTFTEAALTHWLAPPEAMAGQLLQLQTATYLPKVTIGIIPAGVPLQVAPMDSVILYDGVPLVESSTGQQVVHDPEQQARILAVADALEAEAVTGADARAIIAAAAAKLP